MKKIIIIICIVISVIGLIKYLNSRSKSGEQTIDSLKGVEKTESNLKLQKTVLVKNDLLSFGSKESPIQISEGKPVTERHNYIAPRFSPDGLDIIFSGPNYNGLFIVPANGSTAPKQLSDSPGIGYNTQWSADGTRILFNEEGTIKAFDLSGQEIAAKESDFPSSPVFAKEDNIFIKKENSDQTIQLTEGEDKYFKPVLSPDKSKVAYLGLEGGIYIKDLENNKTYKIGKGTDVSWSPDSTGLLYNYTEDDGHDLVSGDIYYARADGSKIWNITNSPKTIEINPSISNNGSMITYEVDGQIFISTIIWGR